MFKKISSTISVIIVLITIISFFVNINEYKENYGMSGSDDSKSVVVVAVIVIVIAIIPFIFARRKNKEIIGSKKLSPATVNAMQKKNSLQYIFIEVISILLLLVITEEVCLGFLIRSGGCDIFEASYYAGEYQIFREHSLLFSFVILIDNIIT